MEDIKVSIVCNAYNQEDYIEEALKSFLAQETTFDFEVLVHDDASTDGTAAIIAKYASLYPSIVKPYYEEVNQYTVGDAHNFAVQSARVQGDYVALCEGDDYWTDPHKLQMQYELLEQHEELDICVHAGECVDPDTKERVFVVRPRQEDGIIPVEDVIRGGGGFVVTNSIFMRAEAYVHPPKIVTEFNLDFLIQIYGAMRGGMYYIDRYMAAYRVASKGSFTSGQLRSASYAANNTKMIMDALQQLDEQTDHVCTRPIGDYVDVLELSYYKYMGQLGKAFRTRAWRAKSPLAKIRALPEILRVALQAHKERAREQ